MHDNTHLCVPFNVGVRNESFANSIGTMSLKVLYNLSFKINIVDNLENTEKHGEENKYTTLENTEHFHTFFIESSKQLHEVQPLVLPPPCSYSQCRSERLRELPTSHS